MKTKLLFVTALSVCFSLHIWAQDEKTVKSKLEDATVFFQGAELVHTASYSLLKGDNEIYIEGLSPNIDKNSLKIKASNGVIVSAYEFSVDFLTENKSTSAVARKLQDSIDFYQKKLQQVNTDINITTNLIALLQKGTDKNVAGSEKGLGIDELVKTMDYYKTKSAELQAVQAVNNKKKNDCDIAITRLNKQLSQEALKNDKTSGVLKLSLASPLASICNFTISYYTSAASWVPFYDINIESTDKPIKILSKSKVRQTTGLDWERVKLTLSTATPSNGKVAPLFSAWFLENYRPEPRLSAEMAQNSYSYAMKEARSLEVSEVLNGSMVAEESGRDMLKKEAQLPLYIVDGVPVDARYAQSLDPLSIKNTEVLDRNSATGMYASRASNGAVIITLKSKMDDFITQKDNELNVVYNIDMPYTIPGNGKEQTIDLQAKETTAEYKYYSAPKLDSETYLLAEISDWEKLNLLSGKANITYDGTYVGESFIDTRSTHSKLTLTLGSDRRVPVKREKMQDYSSTRFLGNDVKQVFTYRLTVKNNQNKPVKMVLKDQYPISTQKNIEVELISKDTTPWTANKEDMGVITWEEELKPGETKVYQISYSVKYPKGSNLNL